MDSSAGQDPLLERPDQARLYFEQDMPGAEVCGVAGGSAAVYSARCPGKSTPNEDAAALIPFDERSGVLLVADGVGGDRGGEQASRVAVEAIWTALEHASREGMMLRTAILDGIESASGAVSALGVGAATTLVALEIQDGSVRPYHVGDSMILVVGQRGKIKLQTVSHSPIGFAVEAGVLDEAEAMHHEDRHLVSNVLGAPDMRIEIGSAIELAARDTVLLASDGLVDNLRVEEVADRVRTAPIREAANRLAEAARQRMDQPREGEPSKPDDLTFVGFRRRWQPGRPSGSGDVP